MSNHTMNGEARKPERAAGAYTGPVRWIKSETWMPEHRISEINNMCAQSFPDISLIRSLHGR